MPFGYQAASDVTTPVGTHHVHEGCNFVLRDTGARICLGYGAADLSPRKSSPLLAPTVKASQMRVRGVLGEVRRPGRSQGRAL
jgi:hypothetical protein